MKPVRLQGSWSFSRYATPAVVMTSKGQDTSSNVSTARLRPCAFSRAIHYILQPPTTKMTSQNKCASTALLSQHPVQAGWVLFIQRLPSRLVSVERSDPKTRSVQEPPKNARASSAGRLESKHSLRVNSGLSDSPRHLLSQVEWLLMLKLMKSYQNGPWGNKTGEKLAGGQLVL